MISSISPKSMDTGPEIINLVQQYGGTHTPNRDRGLQACIDYQKGVEWLD